MSKKNRAPEPPKPVPAAPSETPPETTPVEPVEAEAISETEELVPATDPGGGVEAAQETEPAHVEDVVASWTPVQEYTQQQFARDYEQLVAAEGLIEARQSTEAAEPTPTPEPSPAPVDTEVEAMELATLLRGLNAVCTWSGWSRHTEGETVRYRDAEGHTKAYVHQRLLTGGWGMGRLQVRTQIVKGWEFIEHEGLKLLFWAVPVRDQVRSYMGFRG